MEIVLVRHGARDHGQAADERSGLTELGKRQASELAESLRNLQIQCRLIVSSNYAHALETAEILKRFNPGAIVYEFCAFTPHSGRETLEEIVAEAQRNGLDLSTAGVVAFVGHEPRIGQLYARITSETIPQLGNGEAVCASGSWNDFLNGRGKMKFRTGVPVSETNSLDEKVHRKMEVSVFLGALTIPALVEVVKSETASMSLTRALSAWALTLSIALYIAAVYIYDELSMPERFWSTAWAAKSRPLRGQTFRDNLGRGGPVFAHMVHAWNVVFTPAVMCTAVGFLALFWDVEITVPRWEVGVACIAALLIGYVVYLLARPRLAVD